MSKNVFYLLCCFSFLCCQNQGLESNNEMGNQLATDEALSLAEEIEVEPVRSGEPHIPHEYSLEKGSKILRNGTMKFKVSKLDFAKSRVDTILKECKGYYAKEQLNSLGNSISYNLKLRIPNATFYPLISAIENGFGELKAKAIHAKDVTEEYIDLNIRLKSSLAYLAQYKEILTKAKSIKEILQVQEKIRRIEEEIDTKKGRLKYLDDNVKYSTLNLELTEFIGSAISNKIAFGIRFKNAFNDGYQSFLSFAMGLISIWPFVFLILLLMLGRKKILSKLKFR